LKPIAEMTQIEFAAFINSHLADHGVIVVLSGGAAAAFRSNYKYVSGDIDLINSFSAPRKKIIELMGLIGFKEEGRYFVHPDSQWFVEFPKGPLGVGDEPISNVEEISFSTGILKILYATDSVKDRLAWFYYYQDQQCLDQAVWITQANEIDLPEVENWSIKEGKEAEFKKFLQRIQ